MRLLLLVVPFLLPLMASAFAPSSLRLAQPQATYSRSIVPLYAQEEEEENSDDEKLESLSKAPYPEGSQEELMYALGVNLARQLGDVRPLVETGEELAQLAKGLLDSVIGRFEDESQRDLLARRGKDLNQLIAARA